MLLSSSGSVAFTLAIISPTGFFSVTLIVSKGNGLKKKIWWWKNVESANCMYILAVMITYKESFGFVMIPPSLIKNLRIPKVLKC